MPRQGVGEGWPGWDVSRARHSGLGARANGSGLSPKKNKKLMKTALSVFLYHERIYLLRKVTLVAGWKIDYWGIRVKADAV